MKQKLGYPESLTMRQLAPGAGQWLGEVREAIPFAMNEQLLDVELWKRLESQFTKSEFGGANDDDGGWN